MYSTQRMALKLDFYSLQLRLVWANARAVEARFIDGRALSNASETVAWFLESGSVEVRYGREVTRARAGEWLFLRAEEGHQHFEPGSRVLSLRFQLLLRGGKPLCERAKDRVLAGPRAQTLAVVARRLVTRQFERMGPAGRVRYCCNTRRQLDHLNLDLEAAPGVPVLVFTGEHDVYTQPSACREIADAFDEAVFTTIRRADHLFHLERFEATLSLVSWFLMGTRLANTEDYTSFERHTRCRRPHALAATLAPQPAAPQPLVFAHEQV